jgi:hypothetical protein
MRDVLPTVEDVRAIHFQAQRRKNIIPQHANLTPNFNRSILKLLEKMSTENDPVRARTQEHDLQELLLAKKEYEDALFAERRDALESRIMKPATSVRLRYRRVGNRVVTVFNKDRPTLLLLDRFSALHLARSFGVRSRGRDQCVRVLTNTFLISSGGAAARQAILKLDIETFYASISHELLLAKIDGHAGVPRFVKNHVRAVLDGYSRLHGDARGLPDGVPSSAVLAEIYLENFDSAIRGDPDVALYLRYVDDIVIVSDPGRLDAVSGKIDQLLRNARLQKNSAKSQSIVHPSVVRTSFDYLGYKFLFNEDESKLIAVDISDSKRARYESASARLSAYANAVPCWAKQRSVDTYLALFQYLFRPHATADAGHGMRIVTGLAYSARFMRGPANERTNFRAILILSQKEVASRWGPLRKKLAPGAVASCACCGKTIPRWDELERLAGSPGNEYEIMKAPAQSHLDDEIRDRVKEILWS